MVAPKHSHCKWYKEHLHKHPASSTEQGIVRSHQCYSASKGGGAVMHEAGFPLSQEFTSPVTPNDSDNLEWIHEETVNSHVTGALGEFEGWGRGINIPMQSQPLFTGVRGSGNQ